MTTRIRLSDAERNQGAWQKVEAHAQERLKAHRLTAENPRAIEAERLGAAWRINELKELLKLAEPAKEQQGDAGE